MNDSGGLVAVKYRLEIVECKSTTVEMVGKDGGWRRRQWQMATAMVATVVVLVLHGGVKFFDCRERWRREREKFRKL
ncbi:hypothetical protein CsSME_00045508 [Camellia sinensis var. sinensis]